MERRIRASKLVLLHCLSDFDTTLACEAGGCTGIGSNKFCFFPPPSLLLDAGEAKHGRAPGSDSSTEAGKVASHAARIGRLPTGSPCAVLI
jgi:hypothetical protein